MTQICRDGIMSTTNGTWRWSFVTQIWRDGIMSTKNGTWRWSFVTHMSWRNYVYDIRNLTVVICDTDMPWRNYDYDKRNLMVVICDTDMPWRNYVVISSRSRSLVMETANFNHIFEIWWRAVHWQRKPEKSEQSLQWPWWLWSYSSSTSPYHH